MYTPEFEVQCTLVNYGLWHMRRSAILAQQAQVSADVDENAAKTILKSLKVAAGVFGAVDQRQKAKLAYDPNTDFDERLIKAKVVQCLAEAQEIILERARQKKHKPELIAQIARHIHDQYQAVIDDLKTMDAKDIDALLAYFNFKKSFHEGYMLTFTGIKLFAEEKCGDSIKAFQQAREALKESASFAKKFTRSGYKRLSYHTDNMAHDATEHKIFRELSESPEACPSSRRFLVLAMLIAIRSCPSLRAGSRRGRGKGRARERLYLLPQDPRRQDRGLRAQGPRAGVLSTTAAHRHKSESMLTRMQCCLPPNCSPRNLFSLP
jgi:hypothetical protein